TLPEDEDAFVARHGESTRPHRDQNGRNKDLSSPALERHSHDALGSTRVPVDEVRAVAPDRPVGPVATDHGFYHHAFLARSEIVRPQSGRAWPREKDGLAVAALDGVRGATMGHSHGDA